MIDVEEPLQRGS